MGGTAEVEFMEGTYPVTFNHPETARAVAKVLAKLPGVKVKEPDPVLWGEDFSRYMLKVPGTFYFLGSYNEAKGCVHPNHSAKFKADEDVLKLGAASLALLAFEFGDPGRS
jgi:carboxypeptidase Ss1